MEHDRGERRHKGAGTWEVGGRMGGSPSQLSSGDPSRHTLAAPRAAPAAALM